MAELGALDVYVLPDQAGAQLIAARERAFWASKANGPTTSWTWWCRGPRSPRFLEGRRPSGRGHLVVGHRVRSRRRRQCPPVGVAGRSRGAPSAPARHHRLRGLTRAAPSRASTGSAPRSASTWPSSRTRSSWTSCAGSRPPSIPTASSIRAPSSIRCHRAGSRPVNGAQALIRTLVDHRVDTCFMNPGTSEMHFVAALDDVPAMRSVLALFEGVATGAADGYARMAGRPAATLLHLGPGPRQRPGQSAQRPTGPQPGGQHRRRPRHLPSRLRRAAPVRHRDGGPQRVDVRAHVGVDGRTER